MAQALTETKLRQWMQKMGPRLITLSAGICHDRHRAEEIAQEAFIKLWQKPPDAGEVAYTSWLRRVVVNLSINALQRTKRPGALPEITSDKAMQTRSRPDDAVSSDETIARVQHAMDKLDESKRAILMLRACEQLSYDEIAEHLGVPVGTVMSRLNRARTALMEQMTGDDGKDGEAPEVFEFQKYRKKA